ncbi:2353_t:CDS:1, partial [Cetraspora pellucida]
MAYRLFIFNWDGNNSQDYINTELQISTNVVMDNDSFIINENNENLDPKLYQDCKSKIVALEHLVNHLNDELSANNLKHVKNVVDNMKCIFTIIEDIETSQRKR